MISPTLDLRKFVAPEFIIGKDARLMAGQYALNLGMRNILLVTGPDIEAAGWAGDVAESLEEAGIRWHIFSDITPNPRDYEVMSGARVFEECGCDGIVVIGGGSPIDCAKGIGIVSRNNADINTFEGVDIVQNPPPPLICIPTTAGTGADVSQFAIINNTSRKVKIAIISKTIVPDIALIDPVPLTSLSRELTAHTGMDAVTHSVEAYVSNASSSVTDIHALESIRLLTEFLQPALEDPDNLEYRYQTMVGSLLAGLAFSNASLGVVHAMAHSLGGLSDLPHGECNALLLEHVIAYNYDACPEKYERIRNIINPGPLPPGADKKEDLISSVQNLRKSLQITENLGDLGVKPEDVPALARNAIRDPCIVTNPRIPTLKEIEEIYERAIRGDA